MQESVVGKGILYIVATPIGNLGDISARAIKILSSVDVVAAEDTRHSGQLFKTLGIEAKFRAYHDFSDAAAEQGFLEMLRSGQSIALISDAGTPLVSDPGFRLVKAAREAGYSVLPIPGASALIAAVSIAGLPTDSFIFEGFLPAKDGPRTKQLMQLSQEPRTLVFYEAPHKLRSTLRSMHDVFGAERSVFIAREMTKRFEEHFSGSLQASLQWLDANENAERGELVIVVAGMITNGTASEDLDDALRLFKLLREDLSLKRAVHIAAAYCEVRKNALYDRALDLENESGKS